MAKKKLAAWATTVTPFSKMLALSMLIVFPILGFYYGMYYEKAMNQNLQPKEILVYKTISNPSKTCLPPNGTVICRTDTDCPTNYGCYLAGPVRPNTQKTCWKKGSLMPM